MVVVYGRSIGAVIPPAEPARTRSPSTTCSTPFTAGRLPSSISTADAVDATPGGGDVDARERGRGATAGGGSG
jgi:hypothetical protein